MLYIKVITGFFEQRLSIGMDAVVDKNLNHDLCVSWLKSISGSSLFAAGRAMPCFEKRCKVTE